MPHELFLIIKQHRLSSGLSIETIADHAGCTETHVLALELGHWNRLPPGSAGRLMCKQIGGAMGLSEPVMGQLLTLFPGNTQIHTSPTRSRFAQLSWQRIALILGTFGILVYLGLEIRAMIAPPSLSLSNPIDETVVKTDATAISGSTTPETTVTINGMRVAVSPQGNFTETIHLKEGVNEIIVVATAKHGARSQISRKVMRTLP